MRSDATRLVPLALPFFVVAIHTAAVVYVATVVRAAYDHGPGEIMPVWFLFIAIDFPSSVAIMFTDAWQLWPFGDRVRDLVCFPLAFGVLGGLQYFFLTRFLVRRRQARLNAHRHQ